MSGARAQTAMARSVTHAGAGIGNTRGMNQARSTVSVVGAGHVGAAVANALVLLRVCNRVLLYDRDPALAEG